MDYTRNAQMDLLAMTLTAKLAANTLTTVPQANRLTVTSTIGPSSM